MSQSDLLQAFEAWLRKTCFQAPTPEAYDLAKCAWLESTAHLAQPEAAEPVAIKALQRIKLRLHFMGWPAEAFWNAGSETEPRWIADWRYEIALIENALCGTPIDKPEKPSDTMPAHQLAAPVAAQPTEPGQIDWSFIRSVLAQGTDIYKDYQAGKYADYEAYARRLDVAAQERIASLRGGK